MHDFIQFSIDEFNDALPSFKAFYNDGRSIREIAAMTGFPFSSVRKGLENEGVTFRVDKAVSAKKLLRQPFKNNSPPPFGFCYLKGRLVKDAKEYPTLEVIKAQVKRGKNPSDIVKHLNSLNKRTRMGNVWKQPTVRKIIQRLNESKNYR